MSELGNLLCELSDRDLDARMHKLIYAWDDRPKARQILEVLDQCIYGSLASGFVVKVLQVEYNSALAFEGITHEDVIKDAPWRDRQV